MEWVLRSPQIHSTFGSLGYQIGDGYHVNENCNSTLQDILQNILNEDKCLRGYRRNISFGQNVQKDLLPLIIHAKDDKTIGLLIKVLLNLTIPIECLLSVDLASRSDFGRHTMFELKNLLTASKMGFIDPRVTKVVINFLKKNIENEQQSKLPLEQCEHIHDCLTLLRNVLNIPVPRLLTQDAMRKDHLKDHIGHVQNQILWNVFSQGIDKLMIKLMIIPEVSNWAVTVVQLVAVLYKDQHVGKLQKLLNLWLGASLSESSDDNESNTSPLNSGSEVSSPMLTTDENNSDSSDNCLKRKTSGGDEDCSNTDINENYSDLFSDNSMDGLTEELPKENDTIISKANLHIIEGHINKDVLEPHADTEVRAMDSVNKAVKKENLSAKRTIEDRDGFAYEENSNASDTEFCSPPPQKMSKKQLKTVVSENSDCGYVTQLESRESISTSSNDDERNVEKPVHQKPQYPKLKANTKARLNNINEDKRRKKLVKRGRSNILNVKGLSHHTPTDDNIAIVIKEFTVDFLLKGYKPLVSTLHQQILNYSDSEIDRSHFSWLVTYFLKFATQLELDLEHVDSILSFDVVSYLTAEGVNLCEQFELAVNNNGVDLEPALRRLHLVVAAIREFVQAVEVYVKIASISDEAQATIMDLRLKMWKSEEIRSLMVLLLRSYNPTYHSKQYLQDLVVTNHLILIFLDNVLKMPGFTGNLDMADHIRQFASPQIMLTYGILLEDYETNGEFVNDCVFTIMHHVGGDIDSLVSLYQPNILRSFSSIKESEYEICDHWTDLVEYVINSFSRRGHRFDFETGSFKAEADLAVFVKPRPPKAKTETTPHFNNTKSADNGIDDEWNEEESSTLGWKHVSANTSADIIGDIKMKYKKEGIFKTKMSLIKELYKQNIIETEQYIKYLNTSEEDEPEAADIMQDGGIRSICEQLVQDGKASMLNWVQCFLLEVCYVKICIAKDASKNLNSKTGFEQSDHSTSPWKELKHVMSPVAYHRILENVSVPLVPWNCEQAAICKDFKFLQFLHKLGFEMPVDSGKVFVRVPNHWSADILYEVAAKVSNVDTRNLKFCLDDISEESFRNYTPYAMVPRSKTARKLPDLPIPESCYQIHQFNQIGSKVQYTPRPEHSIEMEGSASTDGETKDIDWLKIIENSHYKNKIRNRNTTEPVSGVIENNSNEVGSCDANSAASPEPSNNLDMCGIHDIPSISEEDSICDTASVASDFSRMYVSDEDEKTDILAMSRKYKRSHILHDFDLPHDQYIDEPDTEHRYERTKQAAADA